MGDSRRESISCLLQLLEAASFLDCGPGLHEPKAELLQILPSIPSLSGTDSPSNPLLPYKDPVMTSVHLDNPGSSLHFKILNHIYKVLLPWKVTGSQVLEIRTWTSVGPSFSLP